MSYRLFFVFLAVVIFNYFIALPIFGLKESFIIPILLAVLMIVFTDYVTIAIWGLLFGFICEVMGSFNTGTIIIPFYLTLLIYGWLDKFFNLKASRYKDGGDLSKFLYELISVIGVVYISFSIGFFTDKVFYDKMLRLHDWAGNFYNYATFGIILVQSVIVLLIITYFRQEKRATFNKRYGRI